MATNIGIGQLARQAGVPIDTVRHYERVGLLQLIAACPGHGRAEDCPILNTLSHESWS